QSHTPHRAPVVDLTRFVDLLDWTVAADRFVRLGDAQDLAARLRAARPHYTVQQQDPQARRAGEALGQAARAMTRVSQALELLRPAEAMEASAALPKQIAALAQLPALNTLPFRLLADQVVSSYAPLAMDKATQQQQSAEALRIEREMVERYLQWGHYVQAAGLAREWLVTWTLLQAGFGDPLESGARKEVEHNLGAAGKEREHNHGRFGSYPLSTGKDLRQLPHAATLLDLYQQLGDVRNDIMHAGKRPQPIPAATLAEKVQRLCARLREFPLPSEGDAA
ncbi:MAG TPA: TM1812 family CRISPR-associated protein, partial [Caldilineaceae bacterium]|nr:TM1812 family CRISPR-associated protein [Caldilineaceae bacterium]